MDVALFSNPDRYSDLVPFRRVPELVDGKDRTDGVKRKITEAPIIYMRLCRLFRKAHAIRSKAPYPQIHESQHFIRSTLLAH